MSQAGSNLADRSAVQGRRFHRQKSGNRGAGGGGAGRSVIAKLIPLKANCLTGADQVIPG